MKEKMLRTFDIDRVLKPLPKVIWVLSSLPSSLGDEDMFPIQGNLRTKGSEETNTRANACPGPC